MRVLVGITCSRHWRHTGNRLPTPLLPAEDDRPQAACCLCAAGPPLAASDLAEHRLPDKLTLPAIAATAALLTSASWQLSDFAALARGCSSAAAAVFFLALALITRQVGGGDVKPSAFTGMLPGLLGWNHCVLALLSGLMLAALTAGVLMATRRISRRDPLPLGPFLLAGALIGVLA
jgi:leader peptidase (prepilin peptidase) / N-methyltransferase